MPNLHVEDKELFLKLKKQLMMYDPVAFVEKYLTLDGAPFTLHGNGYRPFADMYRYIGIKALEPNAMPLIIVAGRQVGKDLALDTPIPTKQGWKTMGELQIGDQVFDENGKICDIIWISPIFIDHKCYRLTFDDGTQIVAGEDHQWLTHTKANRKHKNKILSIKTTKEINYTLKTNSKNQETNHSIPVSGPIQYQNKNLLIDPYVLGCWLGDGFSSTGMIESADEGILQEIKKSFPVSLVYRAKNSKSHAYRIGTLLIEKRKIWSFTKLLKQLKLINNKHIPEIYLQSDVNQRLSLLQGLMDTDGCCNKNGKQEFCSSNKTLAINTLELIKSLGIKARIKESHSKLYGRIVNKRYRIYLNTDQQIFRLTRKLSNITKKQNLRTSHRYIIKSELINTVPTKCISVNSHSHLYLSSESFIPTHNTTMASALEMYFMGSGLFGTDANPPIRIMHVFPQLEMAAAYSKTKLQQIINTSVLVESQDNSKKQKSHMQLLLDQSMATNDSLHFKQFQGGNHLWIESTGVDADRIRGRTADVIFFDECQKIPGIAIGNALKILTAAKYGKPSKGVQVFLGTPKRKGSDFYKMWTTSSQQYYYLGCESCKEHFPLYTPGSNDWEKIWIYGKIVKCPKCGHEQDKLAAQERGKWVAFKDTNDPDCDMVGFHINQLYMPMFTREDIDKERPGKHPINTERVFMNEVLGEFYQGDASPITQEEIRELCADLDRKFSPRIMPTPTVNQIQQIAILGIDYGARADLEQLANIDKIKPAGQSYSTAVVLQTKGPQLLSVEFATKFKRNDPESKKGIIDQLMRQYNIQLAVGDIGYSNDFSYTLHQAYGDRYLVSRAHNKVNDHVKFNVDAFPKEIVFERDFYIGELYEQMKKKMIRFPYGDYEKIAWLVDHCSSMEIKPSLSRTGGDPTVHYVKGSSPNDGFMALLNAYLAYKFLVSRGFTNNNPLLQTTKNVNKPLVMSGYVQRKF